MGQEKVSMLRYRGSKLDKVKELDFFPKVEDGYKETSSVGGTGKKELPTKVKHIKMFNFYFSNCNQFYANILVDIFGS